MSQSIPTISVIIPARNEELNLPRCLAALAAAEQCAGIACEKVVVINRCTDRTEEIARMHGCRIVHEDAKNLARIRNAGVHASSGEWIVTVDADSWMSRGTLTEVCRGLSDPKVVGGGILIKPERYSVGILLTALVLLPFVVFEGLSGGLFWCRRADFIALGGFDERFVSVEDIDFARRLKRHGRRSGRKYRMIWREWIVTSCRKFDRFGDWYFLLHPVELITLFRGKNQGAANKVWYDFHV